MPPRPRLFQTTQHYEDLQLHTAASGPVTGLEAVILTLDYGGLTAAAEMRVNIGYLTGIAADEQRRLIAEAVAAFPFSDDPAGDREKLDGFAFDTRARALLDVILVDAAARQRGTSAAAFLGGPEGAPCRATNQTLFRDRPARVVARAEAYVARGFRHLKLRIGFGDLDEDLRLLQALRGLLGPGVHLSADVNGAWTAAETEKLLAPLGALQLDYLEQPIAPGDPAAYLRLARQAPFPFMLDESLQDAGDRERLLEAGVPFLWHLKLVKAGGLDRMLAAAAAIRAAGHDVMVGQMNEGNLATAAALSAAAAIAPPFAELYGADGLSDDPACPLHYGGGRVRAPDPIGIGTHLPGGAIPSSCMEISL